MIESQVIQQEFARHYEKRAMRAIESKKPFWEIKAKAMAVASRLSDEHAAIIFRLQCLRGHSPHFQKLLDNLCQQQNQNL